MKQLQVAGGAKSPLKQFAQSNRRLMLDWESVLQPGFHRLGDAASLSAIFFFHFTQKSQSFFRHFKSFQENHGRDVVCRSFTNYKTLYTREY